MAPRPDDAPELIQQSLAAIFDQAQTSIANHKKNCVALYKIHLKSSEKSSKSKKRPDQGQAAFIAAFLDMVSRVVAVKKGTVTVDRIVTFVAQYVLFVNEKALDEKNKQQSDPSAHSISAGSSEDETLASAFVSRMLEWLVQGFVAKNKVVRYQTVHLIAEMISYLGEIDEDSYLSLRENLIERSTCDKESSVRVQAVSALARLVGTEDPAEIEDGEKSILDVLLEIMAFDPSADVRRAALVHVPVTADTVDHVLSRARDLDPVTRKLVYTTVLPRLAHPRHLTIEQRERVVQTGLGDREPAVRLAAGKMIATWFDLVTSEPPKDLPWAGDDGGLMHALIGFLNLFDVVGPGEAVAVDAVLALSSARPGLFDSLVFSEEEYWKNLTPESAVLARVFVERPELTEDRLERAGLPVVTAFAFHMQEAYNQLLSALEDTEVARALGSGEDVDGDMEAAEEAEEEVAKREVVLGELLRMAVKLDYMDEIGRRKVYTVIRDMLAHPQLPPGLIARCLDVLKEILPTERELIRVVVEIVIDLREGESEEPEEDMNDQDTTQSDVRKERSMRRTKAREDMTPEEGARADVMDLRCLEVCNGMLERVHENFADNSTLEGILADLIVPAVKRKELSIREKGLIGLGLCCLLSKNIALSSLQLFLSQIQQNAAEELRLGALKSLFDLMVFYDRELWTRSEDGEKVLTFLGETLDCELDAGTEGSARVQAILCIGLAKLLLAGLVADPQILQSLLLAYVSPSTADNAELRQCLAYFFSVYCYSSAENQSRLRAIFLPAFDEVMKMHDGLEDGQTMVTPQQFGLLVVDWTDSRKVAEGATPVRAHHVHADLAVDILMALYDSDRRSEDQEVLCTLFAQLHMEGQLASHVLVKLSVLLEHVQTQCPFDDATLDKAVGRFKTRVATTFAEDLAKVDLAEYRTQAMREVYDHIGIDVPEYPDDAEERARSRTPESPIPKKATKGGRSKLRSAAAPGSEGEESQDAPPAASEAEDEDVDENDVPDEEITPPTPVPPLEEEEDINEDEAEAEAGEAEDQAPPSPVPAPKKGKAKAPAKNTRPRSPPPASPLSPVSDEDEDEDMRPASPSPAPKGKAGKQKAPARTSRSKPAVPEPRSEEEEDLRPPSPAPAPKAKNGRTKAPVRGSRSKPPPPLSPPPEHDESEDDDEDDLRPPSPVPVSKAKAGKSKAPARNSRSKPAPPPPLPEDDASGSNGDERPPSSVPPPKTKASKGKAPAKNSRLKPAPPPPSEESPDEEPPPARRTRQSRVKRPSKEETQPESDVEDNEPPTVPSTPPSKGRKRVRTPGAKLSLPSPADTKRRRGAAPTRQSTRAPATRATRGTAVPEPDPENSDFGGYSES